MAMRPSSRIWGYPDSKSSPHDGPAGEGKRRLQWRSPSALVRAGYPLPNMLPDRTRVTQGLPAHFPYGDPMEVIGKLYSLQGVKLAKAVVCRHSPVTLPAPTLTVRTQTCKGGQACRLWATGPVSIRSASEGARVYCKPWCSSLALRGPAFLQMHGPMARYGA